MLDSENVIQDELNQAGCIATEELLKKFDTDGEAIQLGSVKMTTKGQVLKLYQTPYGEIAVPRHVYQTSSGGATFCPLERDARIILTSTPRFASQVSHKMSDLSAPAVQKDLARNHHRAVSHRVLQRLAEAVGSVVQIKKETWSYTVPNIEDTMITTMSIGLDGTCMLMCGGHYRQAMVGTIALYDNMGERQHTMYIAAAPEYGKETFKARLTREIERAIALYPSAVKIGVADGAHDNWDYLIKHTDKQILDFYHATEYLADVADTIFSLPIERKRWLDDRCHELKHTMGSAKLILEEMKKFEQNILNDQPIIWVSSNSDNEIKGLLLKQIDYSIKEKSKTSHSKKNREIKQKSLRAAITYFTNNIEKSRMNYAESVALNYPIGSGVTEAACKTIVKQRLGQSGMQWKDKGAGIILSLRALTHSTGRWEQFWSKVNQCGFSMAS
ncbi:TPA: ISKra4 family transposase [Legionella pneumophila]|nr:ISKra4 family transposase [Legionella pneumophila]HAU1847173.1 ISKra4 family transposase [Legionella pneumophila]